MAEIKFLSTLRNAYSEILKVLLFLIAVVVLVSILPQETRFKYEFQKGRPWMHEDLIAPFDFAILKSQEALRAERDAVEQSRKYYYTVSNDEVRTVKENLVNNLRLSVALEADSVAQKQVLSVYDSLMKIGVVEQAEWVNNVPNSDESFIVTVAGDEAEEHQLGDFLTITDAMTIAQKGFSSFAISTQDAAVSLLQNAIFQNIVYNEAVSDSEYEQSLGYISLTHGAVQKGERIISAGELVIDEKFRVLESLRSEREGDAHEYRFASWLLLGHAVLVLLILGMLATYLYVFLPEIFASNKLISLILLIILLIVGATTLVVNSNADYLYMVPVCLVPIFIRVFFNPKLALFVHIITVLLLGFMVPNGFEYFFVQMIAGIVVVFSIMNLRRRSQFMVAALFAFLAYSIIYFALSWTQENAPLEVDPYQFIYFGISSFMLLFAYPLIFLFEKLFGLITDISLMELVQINSNKLLRKLSEKAPGTLQHSIQVSNLAEEAVFAVGGNALLVQAGAMYHDIGKIDMPLFFTENQSTGVNPHNDLSPSESAEIITSHVIKGIELARRYHLPEQIINFIRMHHGTRKVGYFWHKQLTEFPEDEIDERLFTYHGPVPHSKETAVLMMADSIEAASRSLKHPDEASITTLIDSIIKSQMDADQFVNADITMKDITTVKRIFKQKLLNMYHVRVAYPS